MRPNPYRDWLQIESSSEAPHYYELLGLELFEGTVAEIHEAFAERYELVRRYEAGTYAEVAVRVMDELSVAFKCLTNQQQRERYDENLRRTFAARETGVEPPTTQQSTVVERPQSPPIVEDYLPPTEASELVESPRQPELAWLSLIDKWFAEISESPNSRSILVFCICAIGMFVCLALVAGAMVMFQSQHRQIVANVDVATPDDKAANERDDRNNDEGAGLSPVERPANADEQVVSGSADSFDRSPLAKPTLPVGSPASNAGLEPMSATPADNNGVNPFDRAPPDDFKTPDITFIDAVVGDTVIERNNAAQLSCLHVLPGHDEDVAAVVFSADNKTLASSGYDGTINLWDTKSWRLVETIDAAHSWVYCLAFSPDGKVLASGGRDATIKLWDLDNQRLLGSLFGHRKLVMSVCFSPDGEVLASSSADDSIRLWDTTTGKLLSVLNGHRRGTESVAFFPDGEQLVSGGGDRTIAIWDAKEGHLLSRKGVRDVVKDVAVSPDGTTIAIGHDNGTARLWRGSSESTLDGQRTVSSMAFSHDGDLVAAGGARTITVWDVKTGSEVVTLTEQQGMVRRIAFSDDGKSLVCGLNNGTLTVWSISESFVTEVTNSIGMKLTRLAAGEFSMGSPTSDRAALQNEFPVRRVRIEKPFFVQTTEVTRKQWAVVMGTKPWLRPNEALGGTDDLPATYLSWQDAVEFCQRLSANGIASYRLATEAEWEYACRAGSTTRYSFGDLDGSITDFAWIKYNGSALVPNATNPVSAKLPNAWGLYDMHGNVWELCSDRYSPVGPNRVIRGGSTCDFPELARSAARREWAPDARSECVGFRVVVEAVPSDTAGWPISSR